MKTIVIDTNVLIDYVNGYAPWLETILVKEESTIQLVLPTIVIAEYFTSLAFENKKEVIIAKKTFAFFVKQDFTENVAWELGTLLRRKTYVRGASLADLIIAATAIFLDAPLATRNKNHFINIPNLRFFNPLTINN